jgi:hypothetical protein
MDEIVFDIEADGLYDDATLIHCICTETVNSSIKGEIYGDALLPKNVISLFPKGSKIIGHNIINYDIPMIKKFYGIDLIGIIGIENIVDTYVLSQLLFPDRQLPKGCPTSIYNPITRKQKKIGPHSLEAWGYRVGFKKIEIHDWRFFDDDMLSRCQADVHINKLAYLKMLEEAGL